MASPSEIASLRTRIGRILKSAACLEIRFTVANISIQRFMYTYIGQAIMDGTVHLAIADANHYDHKTNVLTLDSLDVAPPVIVHESTHALINATHVGKAIRCGSHETAAYLAESLWALNTDNDVAVDVPHMNQRMARLARRVQEFNSQNRMGLFVCDPGEVQNMEALMRNSRNGTDVDRVDVQVGIGDGPKR
jgi:hypothetical protein